jgi:hypothetical protein
MRASLANENVNLLHDDRGKLTSVCSLLERVNIKGAVHTPLLRNVILGNKSNFMWNRCFYTDQASGVVNLSASITEVEVRFLDGLLDIMIFKFS